MKRALSLIAAVVMALVCCVTAFAEASTFAVSSENRTSDLDISGRTAICSSAFRDGSQNTKTVVITQTLQKNITLWAWETIGSARTKTVNGSSATLTATVSGLQSGKYRVKTVFKVTNKSGKTEDFTVYSTQCTVA